MSKKSNRWLCRYELSSAPPQLRVATGAGYFPLLSALIQPYMAAEFDVSILYAICRRRVAPEQLAFKICRLQREEPELYGKIKAFLSLKDFVNCKLTGISAIDHTTASYSLLYDVEKRCWSSDCLQRMCLDDTRLPRLMDPWERLGELTPELCRTLGLDAPCPVAVGSVDGSCGILGAGGTTANVLISVMGTTDTCFLVSDKIIDDPTGSLVVNPHVIPGLYLAGGPMGMYGGALEWWLHHIMNRTVSMAGAAGMRHRS